MPTARMNCLSYTRRPVYSEYKR